MSEADHISFSAFHTNHLCLHRLLKSRTQFHSRRSSRNHGGGVRCSRCSPWGPLGVAGVAGQLLGGLQKLNELRKAIRDASVEVQEATESLNILEAILRDTGRILLTVPESDIPPTLPNALKMCERVARQASEIVDRVNQDMLKGKGKTLAQLKAALKKEDIGSLLQKTHGARDLLNTAIALMNASMVQRTIATLVHIQSTALTTQSVLQNGVDIIVRQTSSREQGRIIDDEEEAASTTMIRKKKKHLNQDQNHVSSPVSPLDSSIYLRNWLGDSRPWLEKRIRSQESGAV